MTKVSGEQNYKGGWFTELVDVMAPESRSKEGLLPVSPDVAVLV